MLTLGWFALLVLLCYLIGRAADLVIVSTKAIGRNLGVKDFWLGLVLGILTSTPELAVGIQAQVRGTGEISFGNLAGGVLVLLGLVCGLSVVLQREISVAKDFATGELMVIAGYIALPLVLVSDGVLSMFDGLLLVVLYAVVAFFLMERHRGYGGLAIRRPGSNLAAGVRLVLGVALVLFLAQFILVVALKLTATLHATLFLVGLLVLALGTNLPEITLAFRAWRSHARDLSLGNLVGSAFANGLVLGVLAALRPIALGHPPAFAVLAAATVVVLGSFVWFTATGRRLTRREGLALLTIYLVFVAASVLVR